MSTQRLRYRTVAEVAALSLVAYVLLGAPGSPWSRTGLSGKQDTSEQTQVRSDSLVYPDDGLQCGRHKYEAHVFSTSPLVIYVDGFLSDDEANHFVHISKEKWQVSTVFNEGVESVEDSIRKSEKALIERTNIVQCIEQRALSFQGWPRDTFIERLWTQRYNVSGHYGHHFDWSTASKSSRRVSTFMVYLGDDCEGGGTNFPRLTKPKDVQWCDYTECDETEKSEGVTFRPRKGSAVFWVNFDATGRGLKSTIHAGNAVTKGTKIGLNIWSWYQAGHVPTTPLLPPSRG